MWIYYIESVGLFQYFRQWADLRPSLQGMVGFWFKISTIEIVIEKETDISILMTSKLTKYFSEKAATLAQRHISDSGGNEVFFVGYLSKIKQVTSIEVFCRGNEFEVPALLQVAKQGNVVIHNHPSGVLRPSRADTHIASILGNDGVGFYIVNNEVTDVYAMVEPFAEKRVLPIDSSSLTKLFDKNGPISQKLENFELRPQQIEMIEVVSQAINENKIALVEAGTGTGKTLAYLLPAISYAVGNQERVVVSTNTINLQEQLVNKDLPFLQSVSAQKFKAVLVKGRTNYACKRKAMEASQNLDLFSEKGDTSELQTILDWAKTTKDGSKSELNIEPRYDVWETIQSESDTSLKTKCPFYNECFFYTARRKAAVADVLVANHHLLFSDLAVRAAMGPSENAILPTYDRIVLDEAHHVEDVATSYFGTRVTSLGLLRMLGKLHRKTGSNEKGLLIYLTGKLLKGAQPMPHEDFLDVQGGLQELGITEVERLRISLTVTMDKIFATVAGADYQNTTFTEKKLRLTPSIIEQREWQENVVPLGQALIRGIHKFTAQLTELLRKLEAIRVKIWFSPLPMAIDLQAQLDRLDLAANDIQHILLEQDEAHVRWVEIKIGHKNTRIVGLHSSPLDVASILKKTVYEKFKNLLMTSATLTVEGRFDYFKNRLGLNALAQDKILECQLSAPFDYKTQTLVAIPTDVPEPNSPSFVNEITELIFKSIAISQGRAFVLFTAYGLLYKLYNVLKPRIEALGINVYKQGQENRHRLLERFKDDKTSVLFATDSFWEGVDVHGESLEMVIITKLPFRVPSEPIVEARVEAIERRGGNAFLEHTVPQAAIKFKQGFGRLIRRKTDRGAVLILDKRVIQKRYGKIFLDSLPDCRIVPGSREKILLELENFFYSDTMINSHF